MKKKVTIRPKKKVSKKWKLKTYYQMLK
jgi:hypothetical protein